MPELNNSFLKNNRHYIVVNDLKFYIGEKEYNNQSSQVDLLIYFLIIPLVPLSFLGASNME